MSQKSGKVAVVTGVSRLKGIGFAVCNELAEAGHHIFFTYWTDYDRQMPWSIEQDEPLRIEEHLREKGVEVSRLELDLAKPDAPEHLMNAVYERFGRADILVNNATYSTNNDYGNLNVEELDKHYFINIRATMMISSHFARRFDRKKGGRIVNLSSGQFRGAMPGELAYASTKGAVEAMTLTLAAEVAPLGITVNAINPGPTDTGWMTEELKQDLLPMFPFGRIGTPKDAAKLIAFLTSEEAEWITGQVIHSEGGFRL